MSKSWWDLKTSWHRQISGISGTPQCGVLTLGKKYKRVKHRWLLPSQYGHNILNGMFKKCWIQKHLPALFLWQTFFLQGANLRLLNFACLMIGQGNNKSLLSTPIHSYPPQFWFNKTTWKHKPKKVDSVSPKLDLRLSSEWLNHHFMDSRLNESTTLSTQKSRAGLLCLHQILTQQRQLIELCCGGRDPQQPLGGFQKREKLRQIGRFDVQEKGKVLIKILLDHSSQVWTNICLCNLRFKNS